MSLGLYLHLPFCTTRCTYCPFAISTDLSLQDAYVEALVGEIRAATQPLMRPFASLRTPFSPQAGRRATRPGASLSGTSGSVPVAPLPATGGEGGAQRRVRGDTLYFGGGTPSRTSRANLERIFEAIHESFAIDADAEVTLEANPEDVTAESAAAWRALGVNRLSIGVQSFDDSELRAIGRVHDAARAIDAVRIAVSSGLRTSLDLILGLPEQTAASHRKSLETAVALGAGHLSLYMLDLEERTPLQVQAARGRVSLPEEDLVADLYVETIERLERAGLAQYEISNFARPGEESRHNLRYWTRSEYLGLGLGAHSFTGGRRYANTRDIHRYLELAPAAGDFTETLGEDEVRRERIFLGLRQTGGMCYEDLAALSGVEGIAWIERGLEEGWLQRKDERVAFTALGFLQSNELLSRLF